MIQYNIVTKYRDITMYWFFSLTPERTACQEVFISAC